MPAFIKKLKEKNPNAFQVISYALLGCVASVVELGVFSLSNYLLSGAYKSVPFVWWLFRYDETNGGLCFFLSLAVSFVLAQLVNFIIQRKVTFEANNNGAASAVMFTIMMLGVFLLQLWLPSVLRAPFSTAMSEGTAELLIKLLCMFLGFVITYPLNKYVVMRKDKGEKTA
jgi:putative flippase GtrA